MKLYELERGTRFLILEDASVPPAALSANKGDAFKLHNIDGMYSYCTKDDGTVVHIAAWTEVEVV